MVNFFWSWLSFLYKFAYLLVTNKILLNLRPMSNTNPVAKKTVKIKESKLVDLIDKIVNEAVAVKKQEWLTEQAKNASNKTSVLEGKIAKLEAQFKQLTEAKK